MTGSDDWLSTPYQLPQGADLNARKLSICIVHFVFLKNFPGKFELRDLIFLKIQCPGCKVTNFYSTVLVVQCTTLLTFSQRGKYENLKSIRVSAQNTITDRHIHNIHRIIVIVNHNSKMIFSPYYCYCWSQQWDDQGACVLFLKMCGGYSKCYIDSPRSAARYSCSWWWFIRLYY